MAPYSAQKCAFPVVGTSPLTTEEARPGLLCVLASFSIAENILLTPMCPSENDLVLKVQSPALHEGLFQIKPFLLTTGSVPSKSYPEESCPQERPSTRTLDEGCLLLGVQGAAVGEPTIFFLGLFLFYVLFSFPKGSECEVWWSLFPLSCS